MIKGSIQENKGYWYVMFRIPDKNGKQKQKAKSTGIPSRKNGKQVNKRKAEEKMQEILAEYDGLTVETDDFFFWQYVGEWIERDKSKISTTTYDGYKHMFNKYVKPYFVEKKLKLKDVKPMHLEKYYAEKIAGGLSPNTVGKHATIMGTALKDALKNGYIKSNPAELADKPKKVKPVNSWYDESELSNLWEVFKGSLIELPVYFGMFFGLRRSEAVGVLWSAIDFDKCTLTVCNKVTMQKTDGKTIPVASNVLKSKSSNRTYNLTADHIAYLKKVKTYQAAMMRSTKDYTDYVCVNDAGELLSPDYVTHKFGELLEANHLRHIRFHDLRHSCLSVLANNSSIAMKQVQEYAGHANYNITADTYSHAYVRSKTTELETISKAIRFVG